MPLLSLSEKYVSVPIGNTLNVFCRNTGKLLLQFKCDENDIAALANNKNNGKKQKEAADADEEKKAINKHCSITHIEYSAKHDCFAIVTDDKIVRILLHRNQITKPSDEHDEDDNDIDIDADAPLYQLHKIKKMDKKISALCLSPCSDDSQQEQYLILADKFGVISVYYLPSLKLKYDGAGHLSIISDVALDADGQVLCSADKDFKIRISRFPRIYIIDAFCYGHTQAVTKCVVVEHRRCTETADIEMKNESNDTEDSKHAQCKYIVSGSVDSTVRIWSVPSGTQLSVFRFISKKQEENTKENVFAVDCDVERRADEALVITEIKYCAKSNIVAVSLNQSSKIYLFALDVENAAKPTLKLLGAVDLSTLHESSVFAALHDFGFDENGNLMALCACKPAADSDVKENTHLFVTLAVFRISKQSNDTLNVENANSDMVIGVIQSGMQRISKEVGDCEICPLYISLLRDWAIGGDKAKQKKAKKEDKKQDKAKPPTAAAVESNIAGKEPPVKKRKLSVEVDEETAVN